MGEWVVFVEAWVEAQNAPPGLARQVARAVLDDCVRTEEISEYQAHRVWCAFSDSGGYS